MPTITPIQKRRFIKLRQEGYSIRATCMKLGVSYSWGKAFDKGMKNNSGQEYAKEREQEGFAQPLEFDELTPEVVEALEDIQVFALRYFGITLAPYQVKAANLVVELLETHDEEYVCINWPPGTGKSTFTTRILTSWLTCKNRAIRGLIGSVSERLASKYTAALRDDFERPYPIAASLADKRSGLVEDAISSMPLDFGVFKGTGIWRANEFRIVLPAGITSGNKEPTWSAFGTDTSFIGTRSDICVWDDPWDPRMKDPDQIEEYYRQWDQVCETRLEPGGLFLLQMQRLAAQDVSRYCLDKNTLIIDDDGNEKWKSKYHHIKFPAHFKEKCQGDHGRDAKAWPDGCLLFPQRLGWEKLEGIRQDSEENFMVTYQQEDVDPEDVLCRQLWIDGGIDDDGSIVPGCWDEERVLGEIPTGLTRPIYSYATVDPSGSKFWALQWWVYHPATQQRFLVDVIRKKLRAPNFLGYTPSTKEYTGIANDWVLRGEKTKFPIRWLIVEQNAAQRYLLQYQHVLEWARAHHVRIIPHDTYGNKTDPDYGVMALLRPLYKHGLVRLPGGDRQSKIQSQHLINEVTQFPGGVYEDQTMAQWFGENRLPSLVKRQEADKTPRQWRPDFAHDPLGVSV